MEELRRELQTWTENIETALDEIRGHRGTPKFYADVDANNLRFTNLGDPQSPNDAQKLGLALSRQVINGDYDAGGATVTNVRFAIEDSEAVPLAQINRLLDDAILEPDTPPPKVNNASVLGDRTEGFSYGNHTHQGVNLDAAQTISAEKTFTAAILLQHHIIVDDVSPSQITSNQNDYDPGSASVWRLTTDASRTITGFTGHGNRERLAVVVNIGSNDLVIAHQSASSSAANRVITATAANVTLTANQSTILWYDSVTARWRQVVSSSTAAGGGGVELWTTGTSRTTGIAAVNLNAGANYLGSAIDNSANLDTWATISATFLCGTAPTAGTEVEVYLLYAPDGTNYQDGDASPIDPVGGYVGSFIARNVTTQQYPVAIQVPLQPFKFKILLKSELNQNISSTSLTVLCHTYNKEQV